MRQIFALSLRQLAGKWRLLLIVALSGLPVILIGHHSRVPGSGVRRGGGLE